MTSTGFVGLFKDPLDKPAIRVFVQTWLGLFEKVEQVCPGAAGEAVTVQITSNAEILWETNLQFRLVVGSDFTWVYVTEDKFVMETSALGSGEPGGLALECLVELPGLIEIIDQANDRRLDELEAQGLM
jgi:hypothetical protein